MHVSGATPLSQINSCSSVSGRLGLASRAKGAGAGPPLVIKPPDRALAIADRLRMGTNLFAICNFKSIRKQSLAMVEKSGCLKSDWVTRATRSLLCVSGENIGRDGRRRTPTSIIEPDDFIHYNTEVLIF